jgi:hypothetical protein
MLPLKLAIHHFPLAIVRKSFVNLRTYKAILWHARRILHSAHSELCATVVLYRHDVRKRHRLLNLVLFETMKDVEKRHRLLNLVLLKTSITRNVEGPTISLLTILTIYRIA